MIVSVYTLTCIWPLKIIFDSRYWHGIDKACFGALLGYVHVNVSTKWLSDIMCGCQVNVRQ